jgi:nucleoside-diphosphate-sugar epimerase
MQIDRHLAKDDLLVITGAGGFIAGALVRYFHDLGYQPVVKVAESIADGRLDKT